MERKPAIVTASALGRTSTGKDQLCISFRCDDGEELHYYQLFEEESNWEFAAKTLKVLGWDADQNGWRLHEIHGTEVLVGREASLVIEEDSYKGKPVRRVKYVNDPRGGTGLRDTMTPAEAAAFSARLRARMQGQPAPTAAPVHETAEDCPF